jgi:Cyanophycinase and related exopeptidases
MLALTRAVTSIVLVASAVPLSQSRSQQSASQAGDAGPSSGWLILEGGGALSGTSTAARFTELAGGPTRNIVVISTAIADSQFVTERKTRCESRTAQVLGVASVTCLDARDRDEANGPAFIEKLSHANGVWIYGGDEERLVDRYVGTKVVAALRSVLDRGGVIGGTSAGAMILASYIPSRATQQVSAFGFLQRTAIAPHYAQRNYESALRKMLSERPSFRGIGIDESTSIVVHAGRFEVIGNGTVTVLNDRKTVLKPGDQYDLRTDSKISS